MPNISVRRAKLSDAADIAELAARTFLEAFGPDNKPDDIDTYVGEAFNCDTVTREIRDLNSAFFMVIRDAAIIAYAKLRKSRAPDCVDGPNPIEIERIYVDTSHQSSGVGATLMRAVIDHARSEGYHSVWLGVWEKNSGARRFYERQGFALAGTKDFMLGNDRQHDVVMSRILS